jgi:hypothetical protein
MVQMSRSKSLQLTDEQWERSGLHGELEAANGAAAAKYDRRRDVLIVTMKSGAVATMPRKLFPELARASAEELSDLEITPLCTSILFRSLEEAISVFGLIREAFGINVQNRIAGMTTSQARAQASRRNGKRGGRPKATTR